MTCRRATRALDALATIATKDAGDRWTRAAILTAVPGQPGKLVDRIEVHTPGFFATPDGRVLLSELAVLIGAENDSHVLKAVIERAAA